MKSFVRPKASKTLLFGAFSQSSVLIFIASDFNPLTATSMRVAVVSAKNHKRQRRKRQSVTAKREKSQTPKILNRNISLT